jgi:Holliday junction resolvase
MTNSRQKGKRGELALVHLLQDHGLVARRGQQFKGTADSPDVICDSLPWVHWECKWRQAHRPWDWMHQAMTEADGKMPVVAMKRNRDPWLVVLRIEDFLKLAMEMPDDSI